MAEFQRVAYEKIRLCETFEKECSSCPLADIDCGILCVRYAKDGEIAKLEKAVMDWAEKNPEPVYPTWGKWLSKTFFNPSSRILSERIPVDIAKKLGIEPESEED